MSNDMKEYELLILRILYKHKDVLTIRGLYNILEDMKNKNNIRYVPSYPTLYRRISGREGRKKRKKEKKVEIMKIIKDGYVEVKKISKNRYNVKLTKKGEIYTKFAIFLQYRKQEIRAKIKDLRNKLSELHKLLYELNEKIENKNDEKVEPVLNDSSSDFSTLFSLYVGLYPVSYETLEIEDLEGSIESLIEEIMEFYINTILKYIVSNKDIPSELAIYFLEEYISDMFKEIKDIIYSAPLNLRNFVSDLILGKNKNNASIGEDNPFYRIGIIYRIIYVALKVLNNEYDFSDDDFNGSDDVLNETDSAIYRDIDYDTSYIKKISMSPAGKHKYPTVRLPEEYNDLIGKEVYVRRDDNKIILKVLEDEI